MLRAWFTLAVVAIVAASAGTSARAEVYFGSFAGDVSSTVLVVAPGFPDQSTSYSGPGGFGFFAVYDPADGKLSHAGISVGPASAIFQIGNSTLYGFSLQDSSPGQGGDSLVLSFSTGGTAGYSHATLEFSDPTGSFFETGIAGIGTTAMAEAADSQGLAPGAQVLTTASGRFAAPPVVPEPATLAMTALGLVALAAVARRRSGSEPAPQ
jgi:hypothetical protein